MKTEVGNLELDSEKNIVFKPDPNGLWKRITTEDNEVAFENYVPGIDPNTKKLQSPDTGRQVNEPDYIVTQNGG